VLLKGEAQPRCLNQNFVSVKLRRKPVSALIPCVITSDGGFLPRASRTRSGFRVFTSETVERIRFIKQAQDIGLSLNEISELLSSEGSADECRRVSNLLRKKLSELDERLKLMRDFRRTLAHYLAECEGELQRQGESAACPMIEEITHKENKNES